MTDNLFFPNTTTKNKKQKTKNKKQKNKKQKTKNKKKKKIEEKKEAEEYDLGGEIDARFSLSGTQTPSLGTDTPDVLQLRKQTKDDSQVFFCCCCWRGREGG